MNAPVMLWDGSGHGASVVGRTGVPRGGCGRSLGFVKMPVRHALLFGGCSSVG